jgi:hypothetical protein
VLLGEDLGRGHDRTLPARLDRREEGRNANDGLAAPDITL